MPKFIQIYRMIIKKFFGELKFLIGEEDDARYTIVCVKLTDTKGICSVNRTIYNTNTRTVNTRHAYRGNTYTLERARVVNSISALHTRVIRTRAGRLADKTDSLTAPTDRQQETHWWFSHRFDGVGSHACNICI